MYEIDWPLVPVWIQAVGTFVVIPITIWVAYLNNKKAQERDRTNREEAFKREQQRLDVESKQAEEGRENKAYFALELIVSRLGDCINDIKSLESILNNFKGNIEFFLKMECSHQKK